jgi:dTDP-4-dehydrorhamnose 3,5-epimerase-like enzyme
MAEALMSLDDISRISLQSISDGRGRLVVAECNRHVSFPINRMFSISGVPSDEERGGHAHRKLNQLLVCLVGRVEVFCDDGNAKRSYVLNDPGTALHVPPGIWAEQSYENEAAVLVVLCDAPYDELDYLRDYSLFLEYCQSASETEEK